MSHMLSYVLTAIGIIAGFVFVPFPFSLAVFGAGLTIECLHIHKSNKQARQKTKSNMIGGWD